MLEKDDKIGDYTLIKFLGRGQFGEVWLGEKSLKFSNRKFRHALKFITNNNEEINLGEAEAEIDTWIEASGHPNVMPVLDMLVYRKTVVIVSEYADGGSLNNWLRAQGGKADSHEKVLEMTLGVLRGIEHLHNRNVVHRDLKPDNILLQGEFPRITDFGVSRIVSDNTTSTSAMGSPVYMSPEAFQGNKSPQTDIWSMGVILYQMLAGEFPFKGADIYELMSSIVRDEPKPLPKDINAEICAIVYKALEKERSKRYRSATEMRSAVERVSHRLREWKTTEMPAVDRIEDSVSTLPIGDSIQTLGPVQYNLPDPEFLAPESTHFESSEKETGRFFIDETQVSQREENIHSPIFRNGEVESGNPRLLRQIIVAGVTGTAALGLLAYVGSNYSGSSTANSNIARVSPSNTMQYQTSPISGNNSFKTPAFPVETNKNKSGPVESSENARKPIASSGDSEEIGSRGPVNNEGSGSDESLQNNEPAKPGAIPKMISGGVLNGKATILPKPAYPPAARAVRASGSVSVQVLIDENGNVISASAVAGHALLKSACVAAARGAKFSPTRVSGYPVKVSGIITYNFVP